MVGKRETDQIKREQLLWEERNRTAFAAERKKEFTTDEGIVIKRVYTPADLSEKGIDYVKDIGFPGEYPFCRGIYPAMYRAEEWMRLQSAGFADLGESNAFWKKMIGLGLTRVWVICDLPTQMGYDSDDATARDEAGRLGTPLSSLKDWEIALDGIDIDRFPLDVQSDALASVTIACHLALAEKRGIGLGELLGYAQNDVLKEYAARGLYRFPPGPSMKLVTDALMYCAENAPKFKSLSQAVAVFKEAGANRVHEVAFGMACSVAYLEAALRRGADIDSVAPGIIWRMKTNHVGFLEEVAKFRATRKVWARLLKERFGARNPRSMMLWIETKNQGVYLTKEEPLNNIGRSTIAVLASALAGVQEQNVMTPAEAVGIPSQEASILALRVGEIVAYETGITNTVDPLAGSYYIESLTSEYEERITKELGHIDRLGGMLSAIENGYVQRVIQEDALQRQRALDGGEKVLIGFNKWRRSGEDEGPRRQLEILKPYRTSPAETQKRITQLQEFKKTRDSALVQRKLDEVRKVAKEWQNPKTNIMGSLLEAVKAYVTLGEISSVFQEVFGSYRVKSHL